MALPDKAVFVSSWKLLRQRSYVAFLSELRDGRNGCQLVATVALQKIDKRLFAT